MNTQQVDNGYSIPLLEQKVQSLEKHVDRLGESHRDLVTKIAELVVTVKLERDASNNDLRSLNRNHQLLVNRMWMLVAAVIIDLIVNGIDFIRK